MPKYFEYTDPEMAAHVAKVVAAAKEAEEKETIVRDGQKDRPLEYANNNREKPFAPISQDDWKHRSALAMGGGKDKFVVAKHREEQKRFVEEYERLACDRDAEGNFHVTTASTAKIARIIKEEEEKKQQGMGYLQRIKAAISLSKEAKEARAEKKELKVVLDKAIEAGEKLQESD